MLLRAMLSRAVPVMATLAQVGLLAGAVVGCAMPPPASDKEATADFKQLNDPLEPTNRFFYRIDDGLDTYVLRPVAVAYSYVPSGIRDPVHNLLANISSPVIFTNDVLQTKPRRAGDTMMRFLINTTVGVGGLFDVASGLGYKRHDTDFGITLALWDVGTGPFLYLPVLGPSDPRDATGFGADIALDPFTWATFGGSNAFNTSKFGLGAVDTRERLIGTIDQVKKTALDPYATFRSLYRQNRQSQVDETRSDNQATVPAWYPQH
jgi:phospholipid-binding lipoprotein MlaA